MKSRTAILVSSITSVLLLSWILQSCGSDEPIDTSIVDNNQIISKENATLNANAYMRETHPTDGARVQFMSDSTISSSCRYGDGWASGKMHLELGEPIDLKCQTNGSGKGINGCMTKAEFSVKDYSKQDGKCDASITSLNKLGG